MKIQMLLLLGILNLLFLGSGLAQASSEKKDPSRLESGARLESEVVIYTAHDQIYSEPILQRFERKTGVRVRAVYDAESAKTVGLVNRLLAERARPRCDVFWNNEILRTLLLKRQGLTQAYHSPEARAFPPHARDPEGHWTGFAARARVIIYNKKLVAPGEVPRDIRALTQTNWRGRCVIANPLFGSTATHVAALWTLWGAEKTRGFFEATRRNQVIIAPGNAMVRDQVALGEAAWGLTDTDDTNGALLDGYPVGYVFPNMEDKATTQPRILLIPNTVSLLKNCPHPEAGRRLIDYLLSADVETTLAQSRSAQLPLRPGLPPPPGWEALATLEPIPVSWEKTFNALKPSAEWLDQFFTP